MKDAIEKNVHHIIKACSNLKEEAAYHVLNNESFLKDAKAILRYNKNDFKIQIISSTPQSKEEFDNPFNFLDGKLKLRRNERELVANVEDIKSLTQTLTDPFITAFYTKSIIADEIELTNKLKHIACIEIDEMPNFSAFPIKAVKIGSITHFRYFATSINGNTYDCYCHENEDLNKAYLFIESMEEVDIDEFKECADVILHCIAIFNGDWYRNDLFIYSSKIDDEEWTGYKSLQFHFVGESIIEKYRLCDSMRCSQYLEHVGQKKNSKKLCAGMDSEILNNIASKIYKNSKIKRIIELLIEGTSTKNLVLRASVYSVAIETLTNIVYNENELKLKPINEERLAEKVTQKLLEVIDEYSSFMEDETISILTKKINNINKPINVDRLTKSFSILGIKLNEHDEKNTKSQKQISTWFNTF